MAQGVYAKEDCFSSTGLAETASLWTLEQRKYKTGFSLFLHPARPQTATADLVGFFWLGLVLVFSPPLPE